MAWTVLKQLAWLQFCLTAEGVLLCSVVYLLLEDVYHIEQCQWYYHHVSYCC